MADEAIWSNLHLLTRLLCLVPAPSPTWCNCGFKQSTHAVQERESIHSSAVRPISMTRVLFIPASFFLPPSISNLLFGNASVSQRHLGDIQSAPDRREGCYRDLAERTAWDWDNGWLFGKRLCNRTGSGASQLGLGLVGSCCESDVLRGDGADLRMTFSRGRRSWHREPSRVFVAMTTPAVCHQYHLFLTQGGGWQWHSDGPIAL